MWLKKKKLTHYERLSSKWIKRHIAIRQNLWAKHKKALQQIHNKTKQIAVSSLAGALLLISPSTTIPLPQIKSVQDQPIPDLSKNQQFLVDLNMHVPQEVRPLTSQEDGKIAGMLSEYTGWHIVPELQGIRLNRTYGYIGKEQHLSRFPGDTIEGHIDDPATAGKVLSDGMAPGLGGWGYFTTNGQFTPDDAKREKYYIAVQTFLAPGWSENVKKYSDFFKWRKMLVVNPQNGRAIVADIGDAGPAAWTGKSLGGSPEVMDYLERVDGTAKGAVLYYFIDDPENIVPLGPVNL